MVKQEENRNPILGLDYPDPDVIRVGDVYYMVSTTMHFMPGCEILRSCDLIHWEHAAFVYDCLDSTPAQRLLQQTNSYGKGMWAASLRYHKGKYYVCFVANDTQKTYLYVAKQIEGPWKKQTIKGFYHDCSLLFDDDDRVYIAYGNQDIYITELADDLSGPKENGLHRLVVSDQGNPYLGYEGTHFYKINGYYYLFFIHSLRTKWRRTQAVFVSASLKSKFVGKDVFNDDAGYAGMGIAQGGIVDTQDGAWYAMLFQDRGAVGRIPVLVPVFWEGKFPVFGNQGKLPENVFGVCTQEKGTIQPLVQSDDFKKDDGIDFAEEKRRYGCFGLKSCWQFNHEPNLRYINHDSEAGLVTMTSFQLEKEMTQTPNMLTQRMYTPKCEGEISIDAFALKDGDLAGLCALQGEYGYVAVTRQGHDWYLVMVERTVDKETETIQEWERIYISDTSVRLKIKADFSMGKDEAVFYYQNKGVWKRIGITKKLRFGLDHFCGCRFGLFLLSTKKLGGSAVFSDFVYAKYHG